MSGEPHLIWIDLEMSGLDLETSTILEIASIVTDSELEVLEEGPNLAIRHPEELLLAMDDWNRSHHGASGLIERVKTSEWTMEAAQQATLEFLGRHCKKGRSPLCGNTVSHDRNFINRYMPELGAFFHYRNVDVSSIKELVSRWYGPAALPDKRSVHKALDDIRESLDELRHYRDTVFRARESS